MKGKQKPQKEINCFCFNVHILFISVYIIPKIQGSYLPEITTYCEILFHLTNILFYLKKIGITKLDSSIQKVEMEHKPTTLKKIYCLLQPVFLTISKKLWTPLSFSEKNQTQMSICSHIFFKLQNESFQWFLHSYPEHFQVLPGKLYFCKSIYCTQQNSDTKEIHRV